MDLLCNFFWGTPGWLHRPSSAVPPFLRGSKNMCDAVSDVSLSDVLDAAIGQAVLGADLPLEALPSPGRSVTASAML